MRADKLRQVGTLFMSNGRILAAEAIGTTILILGGPGAAVYAGGNIGILGVALSFGLSWLVVAYAVGHISGAHINPAVTVGLALAGRMDRRRVPTYLIGQFLGAAAGGSLVWLIARSADGPFDAQPLNFATNLWDRGNGFAGFWAMVIAEVAFTAILVFVFLSTTRKGYNAGAVGLHVGMTLTMIHLVTIPIDNTSVNPARSFAMAIFAGGDALEQLWAFIVFPLVGAIVGVLLWRAVDADSIGDTKAADSPL